MLSSKVSTTETSETTTGPTAEAGEEGFEYISEEDAINMVNEVKDELSERINDISVDSVVVKDLVEEVRLLIDDTKAIKDSIPEIPEGVVDIDSFDAFKDEVFSYFETLDELKKLTDSLSEGMTINTTSVLGLESAFELINKKLVTHDDSLSKLTESLDFMDHKFTDLVNELRDDLSDAIDLTNSAYAFATQK